MPHMIRIPISLQTGASIICNMYKKSPPEKLNYLSRLKNRIPITSRLKHLWEKKKKVKCSCNFKLPHTMKSACKLLNVAICSISFFDF